MTINKSDCNNNNSNILDNNNDQNNVVEQRRRHCRHVTTHPHSPNKDLIGQTNQRKVGVAGDLIKPLSSNQILNNGTKKNLLLRANTKQTSRPRPKSLIIPVSRVSNENDSKVSNDAESKIQKIKVKIHSIQFDGNSPVIDTFDLSPNSFLAAPLPRRLSNHHLVNQKTPTAHNAAAFSEAQQKTKALQRHKSCPGSASSKSENMPPARPANNGSHGGDGAGSVTLTITTTANNACQLPAIENCDNIIGSLDGIVTPTIAADSLAPPPPPRANPKSTTNHNQENNKVIDWKTKLNNELVMYQHLFNKDSNQRSNLSSSSSKQQPIQTKSISSKPLANGQVIKPRPQLQSSHTNSSDAPNHQNDSGGKVIRKNSIVTNQQRKSGKQLANKSMDSEIAVVNAHSAANTVFTIQTPSPIYNAHSVESGDTEKVVAQKPSPQPQCDQSKAVHKVKTCLSANSTPRHHSSHHSNARSPNCASDGTTKTVSDQSPPTPSTSSPLPPFNTGSQVVKHREQSNSLRRQSLKIVSLYEKVLYAMENDKTWQKEIAYGRRIGFYRFRGDIGNGNFSQVKVAMHTLTKEKVAVKILDKSRLDLKTQKMLGREIRTMETLHHPNLIRIFEVVETLSKHFIVMELAPGGELFQVISTHGRFTETEAKFYFSQIVAAIDHMHQHNLIHRDIKAENVFFADSRTVKVGDFGFSTRIASREELLSTFCGSPPYAAPELFRDESYRGPFVDYWALGVLLYFIVTATMPFRAQTIVALKKLILECRYDIPTYVSVECCQLIAGLLQLDPSKRYSLEQARQTRWLRNRTGARSMPKYDLRTSFTKLLRQQRKSTLTLSTDIGNYHKSSLSARSRESGNSESSNSLTNSSSHTANKSASSDKSRQRHSVGGFYDSLHLPINSSNSNYNYGNGHHNQLSSMKSAESLSTIDHHSGDSGGGGRKLVTPSSILSEEERETFRQLLSLGIDEQVIGEHLDKGSWSHIVGTFRIMLHKILRESNENKLQNNNRNTNGNSANGLKDGVKSRNSRSNSDSVNKQHSGGNSRGNVERHASVHVAAFDRFWAYYGRNRNNNHQSGQNGMKNRKNDSHNNKSSRLDPNRIDESPNRTDDSVTTAASTTTNNLSRKSKLMKMFTHASDKDSKGSNGNTTSASNGVMVPKSNQVLNKVPSGDNTLAKHDPKLLNDINDKDDNNNHGTTVGLTKEDEPDYSLDNDRCIEESDIEKILTTQSSTGGVDTAVSDFYNENNNVTEDDVFTSPSGGGEVDPIKPQNGRRSRTSTVTTTASVNSSNGDSTSGGRQSREEGKMVIINESINQNNSLQQQQLTVPGTPVTATTNETGNCLERTSSGIRSSLSRSLRTLKQLVTESNICGNLGENDNVVLENKTLNKHSTLNQHHSNNRISLISQQSTPSSGPVSIEIRPTPLGASTLPPNLTAASLSSHYGSMSGDNNLSHTQSLSPVANNSAQHQHKTATLQIMPRAINGQITNGNNCLPFSLLNAQYYNNENQTNDSGVGGQKLRRSHTTPNVSTCYKRQSNHKNNRCAIS